MNINIEQYIYENRIKSDDFGKIYAKVIDGGLQFFPIDDINECITITKEELQGLLNNTLTYDASTNSFVEYKSFNKEKKRIKELQKLLADTDYKVIKHMEGVLSEEEYLTIKTQRQLWREEINSLELVING